MGVIIKQYEGSTVSPKDDAIMHEIFNDQSGVIKGCEITYLGSNKVRISEGYVYLCGREIQIEEETITSPFSESEEEGEIILKIDLLSETPGKLIARVPREELAQGDLNGDNTVYEFLMATYTANSTTLENLTTQYEIITAGAETVDPMLATKEGFAADALKTKEAIGELNSKFDVEWINNSDVFSEIEKMITKHGVHATFTISFGIENTNAPTDWEWFSLLFKSNRILAFGTQGIAICVRQEENIFSAWSYP